MIFVYLLIYLQLVPKSYKSIRFFLEEASKHSRLNFVIIL